MPSSGHPLASLVLVIIDRAKEMRFSVLILILLFGTLESVLGQEPGFINDPDGYTNIRQEQSSKSEIVGKILDGERFLYYPTSNSNWWKVEFTKDENRLIGFVHSSRIESEYRTRENSELSYEKRYHEFNRTASSFRTTKRDISNSELPYNYFIETIDEIGRVTDLKFVENGRIIERPLCYLSSWIKYEYPDKNTIISYSLNSDGSKRSNLGCDMWYKTVYTLNDGQTKILKTQIEYAIDTALLIENGWKEEELQRALKQLKEAKQPQPIMIDGYEKSTAKLNGKFPISDRFELKNFSYTGLEYEELKKIFE